MAPTFPTAFVHLRIDCTGTRRCFFSTDSKRGESQNVAKTARNLEQLSSCKVIKEETPDTGRPVSYFKILHHAWTKHSTTKTQIKYFQVFLIWHRLIQCILREGRMDILRGKLDFPSNLIKLVLGLFYDRGPGLVHHLYSESVVLYFESEGGYWTLRAALDQHDGNLHNSRR